MLNSKDPETEGNEYRDNDMLNLTKALDDKNDEIYKLNQTSSQINKDLEFLNNALSVKQFQIRTLTCLSNSQKLNHITPREEHTKKE